MIELKSISKIYRTKESVSVNALKGVSIGFRKSEFVSILGPSGCGKTTLLNIIGGLDSYTSGELLISGKPTSSFSDADWDTYRNHRVGFVFQSYNLIMHLSVLQNVELALALSGADALTRKRKAMYALERVGLADHLRKRPSELSGGEMQRVAIARAIVNDPDVILADEPTGALDSKNSVQIMELLKEISRDKLIIMVTHNDVLANNYSTRIIRLSDGQIKSDSNPYNGNEKDEKSTYKPGNDNLKEKKRKDKRHGKGEKEKLLSENKKSGKEKHTSMSFGVALSLSFRNLLTKKARTTLTSLAASIGIVGLALVLALFNGLNVFLDKVQYDTLSSYPMTVTTSTTTDITEYISVITDSSNYKSDPNMKDKIYVSHLMTQLREASIRNKITNKYVEYVESAPNEYLRDLGYYYGTGMNVYKSRVVLQNESFEAMTNLKEITIEDVKVSVGNYFKQLVGDKEFVLSQYDLVAGKYPENKEDLVLVLDKNNRISDAMLTAFLMDVNAAQKDENGNFIVNSYEYSDFIGEKSRYGAFTLALNNGLYGDESVDVETDYYRMREESVIDALIKKYLLKENESLDSAHEKWDSKLSNALNKAGITYVPRRYSGKTGEGYTLNLKITGILRLKEETTTGSMGLYPIGYMPELTRYINAQNERSEVVKAQLKQIDNLADAAKKCRKVNVALGEADSYIANASAATAQLKALGYAELPLKIEFYATDFASKLKLKQYLAEYNERDDVSDDERIYVTDLTSSVIDILKVFIDTITGILLALTAISLVVAAIMIAIITYVSVIERTREIGVLRSIGARKIDISLVFNAETIIIGLASGLLGVLIAVILQWPLNAVLYGFTGIGSLAVLSPLHALLLVAVSIFITMLAGLIPAVMAAGRDPVKALRAE